MASVFSPECPWCVILGCYTCVFFVYVNLFTMQLERMRWTCCADGGVGLSSRCEAGTPMVVMPTPQKMTRSARLALIDRDHSSLVAQECSTKTNTNVHASAQIDFFERQICRAVRLNLLESGFGIITWARRTRTASSRAVTALYFTSLFITRIHR